MNIGLNDAVVAHLEVTTGRRFALHTYAHFLFRYSVVVCNADPEPYRKCLQNQAILTGRSGVALNADDLAAIVAAFKAIQKVPDDVHEQLLLAIDRAYVTFYLREAAQIREEALLLPADLAPAICVQVRTSPSIPSSRALL